MDGLQNAKPIRWRARIGVIVPPSNTVNEAEFNRLKPDGVTYHFTRSPMHGDPAADGFVGLMNDVEIACDDVIVATGQAPHDSFLADGAGLEVDRGRVVVDDSYRTSNPSVWAGGDCVNGGKEVVNAVAEGMAAAASIDHTLSGRR